MASKVTKEPFDHVVTNAYLYGEQYEMLARSSRWTWADIYASRNWMALNRNHWVKGYGYKRSF